MNLHDNDIVFYPPELSKEQATDLYQSVINLVGLFGGPIGKRNASPLQLVALLEAEKLLNQINNLSITTNEVSK